MARSRNHTRKNNKNIHIWPMLRCKMDTDSKAFLLLWEKDIKENNCSLRRDWKREHMTEKERQERE